MDDNKILEQQEINNEEETVVDNDIDLINALLSIASSAYAEAQDNEEKKLYFHQMMELLDKKTKILENRAFEEKTHIEAEMKIKMNDLDNKTKIDIAKMERNMKILQCCTAGLETIASVGTTGAKLYFATANIGDARRFDANGYVTPSSSSSKLADRYASQVFKD